MRHGYGNITGALTSTVEEFISASSAPNRIFQRRSFARRDAGASDSTNKSDTAVRRYHFCALINIINKDEQGAICLSECTKYCKQNRYSDTSSPINMQINACSSLSVDTNRAIKCRRQQRQISASVRQTSLFRKDSYVSNTANYRQRLMNVLRRRDYSPVKINRRQNHVTVTKHQLWFHAAVGRAALHRRRFVAGC